MSAILAHEAELQFEMGGPAYRLMQRVGLIKGAGPCIGRRFVAFVFITWVPLLVLSLIEGRAMGATPGESFLLDFATYARFFLTIPLLFVAETVAGPRLRTAGLHFVEAGFVRPEDLPAVEAAVVRSRQRREAFLPELIMLGIALCGAWFTVETWSGSSAANTWSSVTRPDGGVSLTGLWYHAVAVPILQFFAFRWLWRLLSWTLFLRDMARLDLKTVPTHADRAGGLGFLGAAHTSLAIFPLAISCVLSGHVAFQLYFEAASIDAFRGLFVVYLIAVEVVCLAPLLVFVPLLARARREGLLQYSFLVDTYNRSFEQKWVHGQVAPDEPLLGSNDIQSLSDLGNTYRMLQDMKIFPFTRQQVLQIAVVAALPCIPLVFLVLPVGELLKLLVKALV